MDSYETACAIAFVAALDGFAIQWMALGFICMRGPTIAARLKVAVDARESLRFADLYGQALFLPSQHTASEVCHLPVPLFAKHQSRLRRAGTRAADHH